MTVDGFVAIGCVACVVCIVGRGVLAKNQTYRAFVARPTNVLDLNGELLDSARVLSGLASEV